MYAIIKAVRQASAQVRVWQVNDQQKCTTINSWRNQCAKSSIQTRLTLSLTIGFLSGLRSLLPTRCRIDSWRSFAACWRPVCRVLFTRGSQCWIEAFHLSMLRSLSFTTRSQVWRRQLAALVEWRVVSHQRWQTSANKQICYTRGGEILSWSSPGTGFWTAHSGANC